MNPTNCDIILHKYIPVACAIDINDPSIEITDVTSSDTSVQCVDPVTVTSNSSDYKDYVKIAEDMGIKLSDNSLSDKQKIDLLTCIGQNRDVFACDLSELGTTPLYEHDIDTGDHKPVRQRFYRTSPDLKQEIERQCVDMEKHDIIERAVTEWQSPVILVKKRNGEFRFAVDYRKLNAVTVPQSYPLPRMDDVFDTLGNANVRLFSVVDMVSGFWQFPVNSSSQDKTGFVTHEGVWRFKKLQFGLINSPATFAMVLAKALNGINWKFAMTYVDDIIIFSSAFNQHNDHSRISGFSSTNRMR